MNNATLWATVAVLVAVIVAGVALALAGMETGAVLGFLTALAGVGGLMVAVLDRVTSVQRVNQEQDQKLAVIDERTNGGLDERIKTAVRAVLDERGAGGADGQQG